MEKRFLTIKETAEFLGFHPQSVYKLAWQEKLPVCRVGRKILIDKTKLENWLNEQMPKDFRRGI